MAAPIRDNMEQATRGCEMLAKLLPHAIKHAAQLNEAGVPIALASIFGFTSVQHCRDLGINPQEMHDLMEIVAHAAHATKRSLASHLGIKSPDADLPRVASLPMTSDQLHLVIYAFTCVGADMVGDNELAAQAEDKFYRRAERLGAEAIRAFANTLSTLHDSVCTGEN